MIDITHWGNSQYALLLVLFLWTYSEHPRLLKTAQRELTEAKDYPVLVYATSAIGAVIAPAAVLLITALGGFFS